MFSNIFFISFNIFYLFYTDPGSGQLILQLIMATLLGGLFYVRKLKDLIFKKNSDSKNTLNKLESSEDLNSTQK